MKIRAVRAYAAVLLLLLLLLPVVSLAGDIPQNARPDASGTGWTCKFGYYRSGGRCMKVPENATFFDFLGWWFCNSGYTLDQSRNICVRDVHGDHCQEDYDSPTKACVKITDVDFKCSKDPFHDMFYESCDAVLSFDVETNYYGEFCTRASVKCEVAINYKGRRDLSMQSAKRYEIETYYLFSNDSVSGTIGIYFPFYRHQEVDSTGMSSASCEVDRVTAYDVECPKGFNYYRSH